jgi:uncharacterized membrane protein YphA (DoxX/SURF4 family)
MSNKKLLQFATIGTGIFFLVSGYSKIIDTKAFMVLIYNYGLAPLSPLAPLIAGLEILLGIAMVLLIAPRKTSAVAFFLLIFFTLSFAYGHFINDVEDCGCFGNLDALKTPPIVSFIRNFILIAINFLVWKKYPAEPVRLIRWKGITLLLFGVVAFTLSGMTMVQPLFPQSAKVDAPVQQSGLARYVTTHPDSTYLVFLFRYDCTHCWDASENVKRYKTSGMVDRIIGLGTGTAENRKIYEKQFQPNFEIRNIELDELLKITDALPTVYIIRNDSVKFVMKEPVHSPYTFDKNAGFTAAAK